MPVYFQGRTVLLTSSGTRIVLSPVRLERFKKLWWCFPRRVQGLGTFVPINCLSSHCYTRYTGGGGVHEKGTNTAETMTIFTWIQPFSFRHQILLAEWFRVNNNQKRNRKQSHLELDRSVLVSVNPLCDPTVVIGESLQKVIVHIKSYPQTEQGDVVLYVLLHILLDFWQFQFT